MAVVRPVGHAAARLARTRVVAPSASYTLDGVCQSTCLFRRRQISAGIRSRTVENSVCCVVSRGYIAMAIHHEPLPTRRSFLSPGHMFTESVVTKLTGLFWGK